jgi:hypothetical protein
VKQKFIGDNALGRYDAMESASDDLIKHMCKRSGVIIKDINYDEVKKLEWRLSAEKDWSKLFCDKLAQRMKEGRAMCFGYTNLVGDAKKICQKFKDVLPIGTIGEEDLLLGMDDVKVVYNGPRHPESRMEQLAFDLVSLVNKSADLEPMVRQMVSYSWLGMCRFIYSCAKLVDCPCREMKINLVFFSGEDGAGIFQAQDISPCLK